MNGLSRLATLMMAAAIASAASASKVAFGGMGNVSKSLKPPKTDAPSASKGGRGYGRNKFGSTAAFQRHATKRANVLRHRAACR
jgi:hypothetical protein